MGVRIIRERIDKPLLSGIVIGGYEFSGITTNNIIVCSNHEIASKLIKSLMEFKDSADAIIIYLWDGKLINMTDTEFHNYLYNADDFADNIIIQQEFDCVEIQFREYAIQRFYISHSPDIVSKMEKLEDVWFVDSMNCRALTEFVGHKKYDRGSKMLERDIRAGRFHFC